MTSPNAPPSGVVCKEDGHIDDYIFSLSCDISTEKSDNIIVLWNLTLSKLTAKDDELIGQSQLGSELVSKLVSLSRGSHRAGDCESRPEI